MPHLRGHHMGREPLGSLGFSGSLQCLIAVLPWLDTSTSKNVVEIPAQVVLGQGHNQRRMLQSPNPSPSRGPMYEYRGGRADNGIMERLGGDDLRLSAIGRIPDERKFSIPRSQRSAFTLSHTVGTEPI